MASNENPAPLEDGATAGSEAAAPTADEVPQMEQYTGEELDAIIARGPLMIFIKGTGDEPFCKHSKRLVAALNEAGLEFAWFNIFDDKPLRGDLKIHSGCTTYPQVYVHSVLVGGADDGVPMAEDGSLGELIAGGDAAAVRGASPWWARQEESPEVIKTTLTPDEVAACQEIVNRAKVMLFLKGNPIQPQCGFSARAVEVLTAVDARYCMVDILKDATLRENLKIYSRWDTFPQVWVDGLLVGGAEILEDLHKDGNLDKVLSGEVHLHHGAPPPGHVPPI